MDQEYPEETDQYIRDGGDCHNVPFSLSQVLLRRATPPAPLHRQHPPDFGLGQGLVALVFELPHEDLEVAEFRLELGLPVQIVDAKPEATQAEDHTASHQHLARQHGVAFQRETRTVASGKRSQAAR